MFKKLSKKGFTLVELLIVIVIIGILAVSVGGRFRQAPGLARNSQRITAVGNLAASVEEYYSVKNNLPGDDVTPVCIDDATLATDGITKKGLVDLVPDYIPALTKDPKTSGTPSSGACATATGYGWMPLDKAKGEYVLVAGLEGAVDLAKPGYTCWSTISAKTKTSELIAAAEADTGTEATCTAIPSVPVFYIAK